MGNSDRAVKDRAIKKIGKIDDYGLTTQIARFYSE
jgi:hypothetical protein